MTCAYRQITGCVAPVQRLIHGLALVCLASFRRVYEAPSSKLQAHLWHRGSSLKNPREHLIEFQIPFSLHLYACPFSGLFITPPSRLHSPSTSRASAPGCSLLFEAPLLLLPMSTFAATETFFPGKMFLLLRRKQFGLGFWLEKGRPDQKLQQ